MQGEEFHISLTDGDKPFCVRTPRVIPFAYRDKLKAELGLLLEQGIIAPVTEPTEWCAPIVVTPKKGVDQVRLCVDLSHLNKFVRRERYQSSTPAQAVADIAADSARIFTKLDAMKGYHQCPLDEDSQLLTTFITHLVAISFFVHHTGSRPFQNTTIVEWMRPSQGSLAIVGLWMTSSFTMKISISILTMSGGFYRGVQSRTSP